MRGEYRLEQEFALRGHVPQRGDVGGIAIALARLVEDVENAERTQTARSARGPGFGELDGDAPAFLETHGLAVADGAH